MSNGAHEVTSPADLARGERTLIPDDRILLDPDLLLNLPGRPCGNMSPSGRWSCNNPAPHDGHSFVRDGRALAVWPAKRGGPVEQYDNPSSGDLSDRAGQLEKWWLETAETEILRTVPKAIEYGSGDLAEIGHDLARLMGRTVSDQQAIEIGIYFYIRGKLARWADALIRGEQASDDTLFDLGVYTRMAQRNRAVGGWPFPREEQDQ